MGRQVALVLALLAGVLIAWSQLRLPAPAGADAPETGFSAARALQDVAWISARPHPIGSTANHQVRDRLRARLDDLGFSVRMRRDDVAFSRPDGGVAGGSPETLIATLPGRDREAAPLAVMAHYDSVPGAPGAADDAAGVATALELARAIEARGPPARDLVLILTDGEEAGLLGGRAVFARDPLARRLGLLVNLEARGSGGRALMFQTGAFDGAAVDLFRRTATRLLTGSLFGAVYAFLPNDTDFSPARAAGRAGFNFAFAGQAFDYHSPSDSVGDLQPGALQDLGDQALAVAAAAAFADGLPPARGDAVFGGLFGRATLAYPPAVGWLVLLAALALMAVAALRAHARAPLPWMEVVRGAGAAVYALAGTVCLLHLAGVAAVAGTGMLGARRLLAVADRWEAAQLLLAVGFLLFAAAEAARARRTAMVLLPLGAALAACALTRSLDLTGLASGLVATGLAFAIGGGAVGRPAGWAGVLIVGFVAAVAAQAAAPLAAYVLAWPLLVGALAAAVSGLSADRRLGPRLALPALSAAAFGWAGVLAHLVVVVTGLPELLALPLFAAALVAWPLAQPAPAPSASTRAAGRGLLLAGAALVALVRLANPWDARHPQPSFVAYQLDQDAGRAWRVAIPALRTAWSDSVLQAEGGRIGALSHWAWDQPMAAAPARLVAAPVPAVTLTHGPGDLLFVKVTPPAGTRTLALELAPDAPARLLDAGAARLDAPLPARRWTRLDWSAPNADGLTLTLQAHTPGRLRLRYQAGFDRWPPGVAPPKPPPPGVMARGRSGEAVATGSRMLAW